MKYFTKTPKDTMECDNMLCQYFKFQIQKNNFLCTPQFADKQLLTSSFQKKKY